MVLNCGPGEPVGTDGCVPPMPPPAPDEPYTLPWWLNIVSPSGLLVEGRSRTGPRPPRQAALRPGVVAPRKRLGPPPAAGPTCRRGTGVLRDVRADAQSTPAEILSLLPTAADILRGRPTTKNETLFGGAARLPDGVRHVFRSRDRGRSAAGRGARCRGLEQEQGFGGRSDTLDPRPGSADGPRVLRALPAARRDRTQACW